LVGVHEPRSGFFEAVFLICNTIGHLGGVSGWSILACLQGAGVTHHAVSVIDNAHIVDRGDVSIG